MTEEWRTCGCHAGYEVSNFGRVRNRRKGNILKHTLASHGYPMVSLGRKIKRTVHSLVADAFLGPCPSGQEVRHKDDERWNPSLDNLQYGTRAENIKDMFDRGRQGDYSARARKTRQTKLVRYGPEGDKASAAKTLATKTQRYGPSWGALGFAGVEYSKL